MKEYQIKDTILKYLIENDNFFNAPQVKKGAGLNLEGKLIHAYLQRMEQEGYTFSANSSPNYFKISGDGHLFFKDGGYTNLWKIEKLEEEKEIEREMKLEILDNLNLKNLKLDIPIKILTGLLALAGFIMSIIALTKK